MDKARTIQWSLLAVPALMCFAFYFWLAGGIGWLATDVFPPQRPGFMPVNSVWIDAPSLPLSWHHGWWFGCRVSESRRTNFCLLVSHGQSRYQGDYLSCRTHAPISEKDLKLIAPRNSMSMWLDSSGAVAGFTRDGDILLPVGMISKCEIVRAKLSTRQ